MGVSPGAEAFELLVVAMGLNYHFPWRGTSVIFSRSELWARWVRRASNIPDVDPRLGAVSEDVKSSEGYLRGWSAFRQEISANALDGPDLSVSARAPAVVEGARTRIPIDAP